MLYLFFFLFCFSNDENIGAFLSKLEEVAKKVNDKKLRFKKKVSRSKKNFTWNKKYMLKIVQNDSFLPKI